MTYELIIDIPISINILLILLLPFIFWVLLRNPKNSPIEFQYLQPLADVVHALVPVKVVDNGVLGVVKVVVFSRVADGFLLMVVGVVRVVSVEIVTVRSVLVVGKH